MEPIAKEDLHLAEAPRRAFCQMINARLSEIAEIKANYKNIWGTLREGDRVSIRVSPGEKRVDCVVSDVGLDNALRFHYVFRLVKQDGTISRREVHTYSDSIIEKI